MAEIERLLRDLNSKKPATRYDACETLRVAASIPTSAIDALRLATSDPDPNVADAASRALRVHDPTPTPSPPQQVSMDTSSPKTTGATSAIGCFVAFALFLPTCAVGNFLWQRVFLDLLRRPLRGNLEDYMALYLYYPGALIAGAVLGQLGATLALRFRPGRKRLELLGAIAGGLVAATALSCWMTFSVVRGWTR
jgi:hypothetical protein